MMTAYDRLSALCLVIQAADSNLQRYYLQNRYETLEKYYNNKSAEMTFQCINSIVSSIYEWLSYFVDLFFILIMCLPLLIILFSHLDILSQILRDACHAALSCIISIPLAYGSTVHTANDKIKILYA